MEKTGFLEDSPGVQSSNRLIFVIGTVFNIAMCAMLLTVWTYMKLHGMTGCPALVEILAFNGGLQAVFSGSKLVHQAMEPKDSGQTS